MARIFEERSLSSNPHPGCRLIWEMICHLLNQFFIIVRRLLTRAQPPGQQEHEESLDMIRSIISFIEAHYAKNIRTSDIAASIGFSPSRACHAFKRATGKTISHYLHEVRIQRAKNLLLMSDQQVAAIAYEVGYNDLSYFNRWFPRSPGFRRATFGSGSESPRRSGEFSCHAKRFTSTGRTITSSNQTLPGPPPLSRILMDTVSG